MAAASLCCLIPERRYSTLERQFNTGGTVPALQRKQSPACLALLVEPVDPVA